MEKRESKKCALTGHRVLNEDFSVQSLREKLLFLIEEEKIATFFCGMARGFDLVACEELCRLREEKPLKIVACVPCADQAKSFDGATREIYERLLRACDEKIVFAPHYTSFCMFQRNRYMIDNADAVLAYYRRAQGGTAYTVRYALQKSLPVFYL